MKNTIIFYASLLILTACGNTLAQTDSAIQSDIIIDSGNIDTTDATPAATQTLVIDVETLKAPKGPLTTTSYETALRNILSLFDKEGSIIVAHTRQTRPVVESGNPFFCTLYRAYADHRPIELSPEALWLLICQGFSLHVDNNAESLRSMFVDFEGKRTLTVQALLDVNNPNTPWEKYFPQFTSQIATYTGQELINALTADFTTSTPASRTASQITVMESMKHYFDYEMTICGIPQVILHGTPEDSRLGGRCRQSLLARYVQTARFETRNVRRSPNTGRRLDCKVLPLQLYEAPQQSERPLRRSITVATRDSLGTSED